MQIEAAQEVTGWTVAPNVPFRLSPRIATGATGSPSHMLIKGLTPLASERPREVVSEYEVIDAQSGTVYEEGSILVELPEAAVVEGASPIVGIVPLTELVSGSEPSSTVGGSSGLSGFAFSNNAGTLSLAVNNGATTFTGDATYSVVDETTVALAAFSLTDGSNVYAFKATTLDYANGSYVGELVSEGGDDFDSLLFKLVIAQVPDSDGDGLPDFVDGDVQAVGNPWEGVAQNANQSKDTWFGNLWDLDYPYVYHSDHFWVWVQVDGPGIYVWSFRDDYRWFYTLSTFYPWIYSFREGKWLWFYTGGGVNAPRRWFYDPETQTDIPFPPLP